MGTLYICYFGLREPLVQTQVLPYLRGLAADGVVVHLLTFESAHPAWADRYADAERARLAGDGIRCFSRRYHKSPSIPATLFDIAVGAWSARRIARRHRVDVLHARSHIPLAMMLVARAWTSRRMVFDLRGLLADEYVAAGRWRQSSFTYRIVKRLERIGLRRADQIIVLSRRAEGWLIAQGVPQERIACVPCCVDSERFSDGSSYERPRDPLQLIYLGSVTGMYRLDLAARFVAAVRSRGRPAVLKVLSEASASEISRALEQAGMQRSEYSVERVTPAETARALRGSAAGLCFLHTSAADIARSPAKIGEYLAAGLPVVTTAGIGDLDDLFDREHVGVSLRSPSAADLDMAAASLLALIERPDIERRCRDAARRHFELATVGIPGYRNVYRRLQGLRPSANPS
jgi:glycosyltransferase involved in cell wall biosynthesis